MTPDIFLYIILFFVGTLLQLLCFQIGKNIRDKHIKKAYNEDRPFLLFGKKCKIIAVKRVFPDPHGPFRGNFD